MRIACLLVAMFVSFSGEQAAKGKVVEKLNKGDTRSVENIWAQFAFGPNRFSWLESFENSTPCSLISARLSRRAFRLSQRRMLLGNGRG